LVIALLDNGQDLGQCAAELGSDVGQLLTPLTRYKLRDPDRPWGIDNGFFSPEASIKSWLSLLERERHHQEKCLFVTLPDVVGSARRTLEVFDHWRRDDRLSGWPCALVCQDGQENLPIPWVEIAAVFLGGSTNWKCGPHAVHDNIHVTVEGDDSPVRTAARRLSRSTSRMAGWSSSSTRT
jgi:hypothetical protein